MRKAALLRELDLCDDALPNLGSWKADIGYLELIVATIRELRPMHVVELGAGASTLVAGRALALNGGGTLHSCDQHGEFVDATSRWLEEHGVAVDLRAAPLVPAPDGWPGQWYDHGALPDRIDLLLIDGPPWTVHPLVRGAAASLFDRIPVGGMVLLDDGARPGERMVAHKWRKAWPGFRFDLVKPGTKGTLIGRRIR